MCRYDAYLTLDAYETNILKQQKREPWWWEAEATMPDKSHRPVQRIADDDGTDNEVPAVFWSRAQEEFINELEDKVRSMDELNTWLHNELRHIYETNEVDPVFGIRMMANFIDSLVQRIGFKHTPNSLRRYTVELLWFATEKKIATIKLFQEYDQNDSSLAELKRTVESVESFSSVPIVTDVSAAVAKDVQRRFNSIGASVRITEVKSNGG